MVLGSWLSETILPFFGAVLPLLLWMAFWLFAVNWKKVWPTLAEGAWAPCVLLGLISAFVWSRIDPRSFDLLGLVAVHNFWWQLGFIAFLFGSALFAGWLQAVLHYSPIEVAVEPPAHHDHGHGHGDDHGHGHDDHASPATHDHGHGHH